MLHQSLSGYGMKWFIFLVCFVAVQFVHGTDVKLVVPESYSLTQVDLVFNKINGTGPSFQVTTNKGKNILFLKEESKMLDGVEIQLRKNYGRYEMSMDNCTPDLNGKWIVKIKTKEGVISSEEFYIQIKKKIDFGGESVILYDDHYAIYKYPMKFNNLETCFLLNQNGSRYDLLLEKNSELKIKEPNMCGVRIRVNETETHDSSWTLFASDVKSNEIFVAEIYLQFIKHKNYELPSEYFQLGTKHVIEFSMPSYPEKMIYCQLKDPNGMMLPRQIGSCSYKIPYVTKFHEGLWKIYYGLEGNMFTLETSKNIITYDQLSSSVTFDEGNNINLLCQIRTKQDRDGKVNCQFTRPDNKILSVTPGIGYDKYEYYRPNKELDENKKNRNRPYVYDCGVTIKSPSKEDFGAWKCGINLNNKMIGTVFNVENLAKSVNSQTPKSAVKSKVFVEKGNSFTVMCSENVVLDYCWMLSPNGTVYTVSKNGNSTSDLKYKGSGLEFGECGAIIKVADDTHQGDWSCRMGVANKPEIATAVSVTVTDSLLIADESTINIVYKNPTTLKCRVLPGYDNAIDYCRWIRPDGLGIYYNVDNKYVTKTTLSTCILTIQEINVEHDIGSWYCVAGISGQEMRQATTKIEINYSALGLGGIVSISLAIALLVITTITLFVIIVRRRNRNIQPDEKVFYYK